MLKQHAEAARGQPTRVGEDVWVWVDGWAGECEGWGGSIRVSAYCLH
jgi:hypothetical protein